MDSREYDRNDEQMLNPRFLDCTLSLSALTTHPFHSELLCYQTVKGTLSGMMNSAKNADGFAFEILDGCFGHWNSDSIHVNPTHPSYNITVTQVREGTTSIDVEYASPFGSGTS
ncbi:hypothetical protein D5086_010532 [Populus alba]|uniref:Uncharacterized protein n=1 Tax=Populus alba TaxID=43335 RepID=A0ACC4C9N9_POPAL